MYSFDKDLFLLSINLVVSEYLFRVKKATLRYDCVSKFFFRT